METNIERQTEALHEVFFFVKRFFETEEINSSHQWVVEFILEELFINMVKYNPDGLGGITIRLNKLGEELRLELEDPDSEYFDITTVETPDTEAPLDERQPGGLGLHLVKTFADGIEYSYVGRKTTVRVIKKLGDGDV